jgi:hypothetical protein
MHESAFLLAGIIYLLRCMSPVMMLWNGSSTGAEAPRKWLPMR